MQDLLACGVPPHSTHGPSAPTPVTSARHSPYQSKAGAYTGTALTWDHLLRHLLRATGPVPPAGGHGTGEMPGAPSAVQRWDLQQDPYGCCGQGVWGESETGEAEDGGGKGGPCWGKAVGFSPAEVLLQLLPSPDPSPSALATLQHRERGQSRRHGLTSWWRLPAPGTAGFPLNH